MMSTDENMPIRGTGQNGKAEPPTKKGGKRNRKQARQQVAPTPERPQEQPQEPVTMTPVAMENPVADVVPDAPVAPAEVEHVETAPVSVQTITNAYGDFTRKSIEQTNSFFEQLAGARSLEQAFELQGAFAQLACETFVSESRKIRELHSELTMQRLRNLESFVARMKSTRGT